MIKPFWLKRHVGSSHFGSSFGSRLNDLSLCTVLVPMADTKDEKEAIYQGAVVQVVKDMQSNSKNPVELPIGLKGEVHKIDKGGDALIAFTVMMRRSGLRKQISSIWRSSIR